ncbi:MAG: Nin-like protein [bacterium]|jgi:3'-phosphoadenosine 5'-phosphosulfate sulfotransferase (PAPS reductase)/FAD synthetase
MRDPFKIEGPACISFSGWRTSGYMLWRILQAHGGALPEDVVVCFANTGREHDATLIFVNEVEQRWGVPIVWLEYGRGVVDFESASRQGEPYSALISKRRYLPNPVTRFCTTALKIDPINAYCKSLGWADWMTAAGMRADEPRRLAKLRAQADKCAPLAEAGIGRDEVLRFWSEQSFDLALPTHDGVTPLGNCDLCFLKGADQILSVIRAEPKRAIWWMEQEAKIGATFRSDRPSYVKMHRMATQHGELFAFDDEALQDCACTD